MLRALIHDPTHFDLDSLKETAAITRPGASALLVGLWSLLWDYELCAQIQRRAGTKFTLKGGAATQLYVPLELQRSSVDIDGFWIGEVSELRAILDDITASFGLPEPLLRFEPFEPKAPQNIPLARWDVAVPIPDEFIQDRVRDEVIIKVEAVLAEPYCEPVMVSGARTRVLERVAPLHCVPRTALIADKLSTLALNTTGLQRPNDLPKHLYDIANLLEAPLGPEDASLLMEVFKVNTFRELGYRGKHGVSLAEVVEDIRETAQRLTNLTQSPANRAFREHLTDFCANLLGKPYFRGYWETVGWKILCVTRLLLEAFQTGDPTRLLALNDYRELELRLSAVEAQLEVGASSLRKRIETEVGRRRGTPIQQLRQFKISRLFWDLASEADVEWLDEAAGTIELSS